MPQSMGMGGQNLHQVAAQQLHQIQRTQRFLQDKSTSSLVNQHSMKQETTTSQESSSVGVPNRHQKEQLPHVRQSPASQSCDELDRTVINASIRQAHEKSLSSSLTRKELNSIGNQNSKSNLTLCISNGSGNSSTTSPPVVQMPLRSRTEPSPEEMTDLEELEQFAKMFKQRRIKLGECQRESRTK